MQFKIKNGISDLADYFGDEYNQKQNYSICPLHDGKNLFVIGGHDNK